MARILVIDDDEQIRDLIRSLLEALGHEVMEAEDGQVGLESFQSKPAELVITDILMPNKEGIQTIMEIRRDYPETRIIAISGGGAVNPDTYLDMAKELGADRILSKPFQLSELTEMLKQLL